MTQQTSTRPRVALIAALIVLPLVAFLVLYLNPAIDPVWNAPFPHFYIVSYISLIGVVIASFILRGVGIVQGARPLMVGAAYLSLAAIFFIHGISTPVVLSPHLSHAVGWSARISLTAAAFFINLALINPASPVMRWVVANTRRFWFTLLAVYLLLLFFAVSAPTSDPMATFMTLQWLGNSLALVTIAMYLWAAWRAWNAYRAEGSRLLFVLTFTLPWLALAQLSQWRASLWNASWWMYHILMLSAFAVTMWVLTLDYEHVRRFRLIRYFTALTIILGVPLVALLSETAVDLSHVESVRWPMFGITALTLTLLFVALYLIVRRGQRILDQRTAALEAEKQWRTDFTNLLVHDLKTPLTTIQMGANVLLSGHVGAISDAGQRYLERIVRSSDDLQRLVNNLLDVERLEAGALSLQPALTDMKLLMQEGVDAVRNMAEAYRVEVDANLPETLPDLQIDNSLMRRVIQNLLTNAIKFAMHPGKVQVEACVKGAFLEIGVIDDGPGVPVASRERIFDKFVQIQDTERRGTGLGLTFARLAVEAHGGRIWVEDAPNGGSRFTFNLPIQAIRHDS